ncbi:AAA family ATPase [Lysinibacillus xylanilyticus]|uniref:AAA family ATPase n=1 Tax=Lysinibacillus xylanilyticus TaxID=582475 RepID=UPI003D959BC2
MIIKQLKIKNFRGYGVNQDNEQGFYVFDNLDSNFVLLSGFNGFGKTSFFEAIEWCLTDKIRRLEKFEENYYVNNLKRAQYLKFHSSQNNKERKIEVEITFNNGYKICRTSYSSAPFAGNGDNYCSELKILHNDEELEESSNATILQLVIPDVEDLLEKIKLMNDRKSIRQLETKYADTFLNTNMLTQENMSFFLRSTNPLERRSMFLKLLNLTEIDSLCQRVSSMRRGRGFSNKKGEIDEKLEQISNFLEGIDNFFKLKKLGSINEYLATVNTKYKKLNDFIKEKALDVESVNAPETITLNNYTEIIVKADYEKKNINSHIDKFQENKTELSIAKEGINKLGLLKMGIDLQKKLEQSSLLTEIDYPDLLSKEEKINSTINVIKQNRGVTSNNLSNLSNYDYDFNSILLNLDEQEERIKEDFWGLLLSFEELNNKFQIFFKKNGLEEYSFVEIQSKEITNIFELKEEYNDLVKQYEQAIFDLSILENNYSTRSALNDQNMDLLKQVREYLIINNDDISECPVCLNSKFENKGNDVSTANHIVSIINNSISKGNKDLERLSKQVTDLIELKNNVNSLIREKFIYIQEEIQKISSVYKANYKKIHGYFLELVNTSESEEEDLKRQLSTILENKKRFEECYKEIFNNNTIPNEINKQIIITGLEKINKMKDEWYEKNKEILNFSIVPNKQEIEEKIIYLKSKKNIEKYYPENVDSLNKDIEVVSKKIELYTEVLSYFEQLEELKLDDTYLPKLQKYNQQIIDKENYEKTLEQIEGYEKTLKKLNENLTSIQQSAVQKQLSNHPIITWIYESINPHPFYNKLVISTEESGTNFKNEDSSVNLDQIFSSAQLNILALSVFLGLGISQDYSSIKQLFLDDPIQSMDDVNILAFIDVLRAVLDSNSKHKKIIISTHDDNFAKLLSIKMRNRSFVEYKFNSYGEEGPFVEKIVN